MKRRFSDLEKTAFDLLVIGGGVYGAWTALDAALRGLRTALIDKGDWASGTSTASTKLIHGGLRYLEHLRLDLVRTSLEERKRLSVLAPHLVRPLRFFMPIYETNRVGPIKLKTGLWLYDLLAGKDQPVAPHDRIGRRKAVALFPFLDEGVIRGGFFYGDCQMDDGRMVVEVVRAAVAAGAVAVNYARAASLRYDAERVVGATVADTETGREIEVTARTVVNAAGPWAPGIDGGHLLRQSIRYSRGIHLVMPALPSPDAVLLMTRDDNRIFFLVPWYGRTLLGTTDADYTGDPDAVDATEADIDYLLAETTRHMKGAGWSRGDIIGCFAGLRALKNEPGKPASQVTREWTMMEPRPGLFVSIGGKFTSARADAGVLVNCVVKELGREANGEPPTATHPLPGAPEGDFAAWCQAEAAANREAGFDADTAQTCLLRYGTEVDRLRALLAETPALAQRVHPQLAFSRAEVRFAIREEMAVHLVDILRRRMPVTLLSRPDEAVARSAADLAAGDLGWGEDRKAEEVARVMRRWRLP